MILQEVKAPIDINPDERYKLEIEHLGFIWEQESTSREDLLQDIRQPT